MTSSVDPNLDTVFVKVEEMYLADQHLRGAWPVEEAPLRTLIQEVADAVRFNYTIEDSLGVGGSGVVLKVRDRNLNAHRALKISRPSPGKEELLARVLSKETESLKRLTHPNLIRIFAQGVISGDGGDFPYYVMDFVEGVKDADDYLRQPTSERQVLAIFRGVLAAIAYLHAQDKIHMDIKPGNVLVSPSCVPIISDLGFAKDLRVADGYTLIGGTEGYMHPDARAFVDEASSDPNRMRGEALRTVLRPTWDCFSLGKTFLRLLAELDEHNAKVLSAYTHRYLKLLACRLLDGRNAESELALGLSLATMKQIKYQTVGQALVDLEKLSGEYNLEGRIPELNPYIESTIQASPTAVTPFTARVRALVSDPDVAALGAVTQLGLLNLVYPTATHTRLEHSLGTFSVLIRYIAALYHDSLNPLFCQVMDEEDLRATLVAALVHDIGQYPLAHDLEEADRHVFSHTHRGLEILGDRNRSVVHAIESEKGWNVPVERVISILSADPRGLLGPLKDRILHSLIDGPIDADKIDYLVRDSQNLELEYGHGLAFERLLRTLTIVSREAHGETYAGLGIHEKGKVPAEAVAFARYALYGQVYWQHTYRAIKAKLQRMAWELLDAATREDAIKKQGYEKAVRERLYAFLDVSTGPVQEELFSTRSSWSRAGQIQPADHAMLNWLASHSGEPGKQLYEHIKERNLFKRILVVSRAKGGGLWRDVFEFYSGSRHGMWTQKLALQREFQRQVQEAIEATTEADSPSTVVTGTARSTFLTAADKSVVLLVDFPAEQSRSDGMLEYVVEEDRRRSKTDEMQTGTLEESVVWRELRQNFHESIGKLRVFCHPSHAEFVAAFLGRSKLEAALRVAISRVEQ